MPSISGNFNPLVGPLIQVAVVANPNQEPESVEEGLRTYNALIDTGATSTCLSKKVVDECQLLPTGKVPMVGATGEELVDQFSFGIGFLFPRGQRADGVVEAGIMVMPVQGCLLAGVPPSFDILLGRDIICNGVLNLSFDGHFIFSI